MTQPVVDAAPQASAGTQGRGRRPLLRVLTFGGADDGRSTLIARLLSETQSPRTGRADAPAGLNAVAAALKAARTQDSAGDLGARYVVTAARTFVFAEMPDQERYARNMIAGASAPDLALLLVDVRAGLGAQVRRHSHIAALFGIKHVLLAVNKMDLAGFDRDSYDALAAEYDVFAKGEGLRSVTVIPTSALRGDNVCGPSTEMPWYEGPTVLSYLETLEVGTDPAQNRFRMSVQSIQDLPGGGRGCCGTIVSGSLRPGDAVGVYPSGRTVPLDRIVTANGDSDAAVAGQTVTLILAENPEVGVGDLLAGADTPPSTSDQFAAHVAWMAEEPLLAGRSYTMKVGAATAAATVTELKHRINLDTFDHQAAKFLNCDEIGYCNFGLDRVIAFDPYEDSRDTGGFTLLNRESGRTVGAGMISFGLRRASNLSWQSIDVDREARADIKRQKPCVLWFTGLSGSGKSTLANMVEQRLHMEGRHTYILDGDNVRHGLSRDLGFTEADRVENIRRIAEVSRLMVDAGLIVLCAFISPFRSEREMARALFEPGEFCEVFMDTPLDVCETRDVKGLYRKARAGELVNFTGIDSPYEPPESPEIRVRPRDGSPEVQAELVIDFLRRARAI